MSSKLYNRYAAQLSAQFGQYHEAEEKLLKYLDTKPSLINRHLTYNDLILYTYRQFDTDEKAIDRCLKYALNHIEILPLLIANFKKHNYKFEDEYIISIEVAFLILKYKKDEEKAMQLCNTLARTYQTNREKRHQFAAIAYNITHKGIVEDVDIENGMKRIFDELRDYLQSQKE